MVEECLLAMAAKERSEGWEAEEKGSERLLAV